MAADPGGESRPISQETSEDDLNRRRPVSVGEELSSVATSVPGSRATPREIRTRRACGRDSRLVPFPCARSTAHELGNLCSDSLAAKRFR